MNNTSPENLANEKDLWDIYKQSRKLPEGRLSRKVTKPASWLVLGMLLAYSIFSDEKVHQLAEKVRNWAELGFNFSIGILGFLIAGFTIFATVTKPSLFIALAKTKHSESGLSYLKYTFYVFMNVFIVYLMFACLCLLIKLFANSNGLISLILNYIFQGFQDPRLIILSKRILVSTGLIVVGSWAFHLIILLQSFIFNIYITIMLSIQWEIEMNNKNRRLARRRFFK